MTLVEGYSLQMKGGGSPPFGGETEGLTPYSLAVQHYGPSGTGASLRVNLPVRLGGHPSLSKEGSLKTPFNIFVFIR